MFEDNDTDDDSSFDFADLCDDAVAGWDSDEDFSTSFEDTQE